jgi:hypothetical protein
MRQTLVLMVVIAIAIAIAVSSARGQTSRADGDAAAIYMRAAKIIRGDDEKNIMAPAASNMTYPDDPPMSDAWVQMERQDYDTHGQVRAMVHQAAQLTHAEWPQWHKSDPNRISYLNECRNLANEIGDAALYQSLILNNQPAAFESARDLMHVADLLKNQPAENLVRLLVAVGIEALDANRLMLMVSGVTITQDPGATHDLPLSTAKDWIPRLLDHPDARADLDHAMKQEPAGSANDPILQPSLHRILETIQRVQAEEDMAAMSLAAHIYQHEHGRWPANLEELATDLPRVPIDPSGDGTQTLGYVLIKGGLPDGKDRPLIYSRCRSKDGLFFRTDAPQYGFYSSDGSKLPGARQKQGGQFRDVARWTPAKESHSAATTQPLE